MLEKKNERQADLKENELKLRCEELQMQKRTFEQEAAERKGRLKLELEERRMFVQILKEDVELLSYTDLTCLTYSCY